MNGVYEPETAPCGVANLANSPAITCDPRLAGDRFDSHSRSPRINKRFLKLFPASPAVASAIGTSRSDPGQKMARREKQEWARPNDQLLPMPVR